MKDILPRSARKSAFLRVSPAMGGILVAVLVLLGGPTACRRIEHDLNTQAVRKDDRSPPTFELVEDPPLQSSNPTGSATPPNRRIVTARIPNSETGSSPGSFYTPRPVKALQPIRFQPGMSTLDKIARRQLTAHAKWIIQNPGIWFILEGHTGVQVGAGYAYNLGQTRAKNVKQFLEMQGIQKDRLLNISYGRDRPGLNEVSPNARRINNRVELKGYILPAGLDPPIRQFQHPDPPPGTPVVEPKLSGVELDE